MALSKQQLSEAAQRIQERLKTFNLAHYAELTARVATLTANIEQLRGFGRRLKVCTTRKWLAAANEVARRLTNGLHCLTYDIKGLENLTNRLGMSIPRLSELVSDLRQAETEFGQLQYDQKQQFLAVVTDPIELAEVYLGEFEIRLLLGGNSSSQDEEMYRIVAVDPHPAASNETVTHPHVQDECLCAGDAGAAIRSALTGGRICDFFMLVRSVLKEYNSQSPYVPLARWEGTACYDCGDVMVSGESYYCPSCQNDFCGDCMTYCRVCEESCCQGCLSQCTACEESTCSDCLTHCPDCRKPICKTCLKENQCPCQQEKENPNGKDRTPIAAANTASAIRSPQAQTC